MRIALLQQAVVPTASRVEKEQNYAAITRLVEEALAGPEKPDMLVLPELWSTGYALEYLEDVASDEGQEEAEFLAGLAQEHQVWFAGGSVAAKTANGIYNRAQIINRQGQLEATYDKLHLVPMLDEHLYLQAGERLVVHTIEGVQFGFAICYDIRFCEFMRTLALRGAQVLIVAAEWPLIRLRHWQALLTARAIENQSYVLAANNASLGSALGTAPFAGHSLALAPDGSILCQMDFQEGVQAVNIDLNVVQSIRTAVPVFTDRRPELYSL